MVSRCSSRRALFAWLLVAAPCLAGAFPGVARAQSVFPDKNLESVVRKYVFAKKNNDQPLTADDVKTISTIEGADKGVKDLTGLEHCRALADLKLPGNQITNVSALKDLKQLQSLTLGRNQIQDVAPLAGLTGLQYLHLSDNQIGDIQPLAGLVNLRTLHLSKNKVQDLAPVAGLVKLWSLYLDGNQIADLAPLANLKALDTLDLGENQVVDLKPLAGLTEWRHLFLENNKITDLAVLVEMGKKDIEGDKRFGPFWRVYLTGNPLGETAQKEQLAALRAVCRLTLD